MTIKHGIIAFAVVVLFVVPTFANDAANTAEQQLTATGENGDDNGNVQMAPPDRPLALTSDQLSALEQLSEEPQHAEIANTNAALSKRQRKVLSEASVHAFNIGFLTTLGTILIMAAPL